MELTKIVHDLGNQIAGFRFVELWPVWNHNWDYISIRIRALWIYAKQVHNNLHYAFSQTAMIHT